MSGSSNVTYYLRSRELPASLEVVQAVLKAAKKSSRLLEEDEILDIVRGLEPDTD